MPGSEVGTAYVALVPSARGFASGVQRELAGSLPGVGSKAGGLLGRSMSSGFGKSLAKVALPAAALAGLYKVVKTGIGEVKDASAGTAQLAAGIKSTGNAAGVSMQGLQDLASKIQDYSGQTDDSIVATEKLLLTFTNIKNKGPDKIFDQATMAAADMAAKMGGDASGAAIQLGKALNDPVKGVTALQKVGVSFTQAQKDQIAAMVAAGDAAGAQKLILQELQVEFGGAAKAAGDSLPGQIEKGKRAFEDMAQTIMETIVPLAIPAIQGLTTAFKWLTPRIAEVVKFLAAKLTPIFKALYGFIQRVTAAFKEKGFVGALSEVGKGFAKLGKAVLKVLGGLIKSIFAWLKENGPAIAKKLLAWGKAFIEWVAPMIPPLLKKLGELVIRIGKWALEGLKYISEHLGEWMRAFVDWVRPMIVPMLKALGEVLQKILRWIVTDAIPGIVKALAKMGWEIIKGIGAGFAALGKWLYADMKKNMGSLLDGVVDGFKAVGAWFAGIGGKIKAFFVSAATWLVSHGKSIVTGLWEGLKGIWSSVSGWFSGLGSKVKGFFVSAGSWLLSHGRSIVSGLWEGLKAIWSSVSGWFGTRKDNIVANFSAAYTWLKSAGWAIIDSLWGALKTTWKTVSDWFGGIKDKVKGFFSGAWSWLTDAGKGIISGISSGLHSAWNGVRDWFTGIVDWIQRKLDWIWEHIKKLNPANWFGGSDSANLNMAVSRELALSVTPQAPGGVAGGGDVYNFAGAVFNIDGSDMSSHDYTGLIRSIKTRIQMGG